MSYFRNDEYRYHSCGCYRWGVTSIDARGSDPCPEHAPKPSVLEGPLGTWILGGLLALILAAAVYIVPKCLARIAQRGEHQRALEACCERKGR